MCIILGLHGLCLHVAQAGNLILSRVRAKQSTPKTPSIFIETYEKSAQAASLTAISNEDDMEGKEEGVYEEYTI